MEQLVHIPDANILPKFHESKIGRFNDAPPNLKELTEAEFAQSSFFSFCSEYIEFRQIHRGCDSKFLKDENGNITYLPLSMHWLSDGTGWGMSVDYWGKRVRYFQFAICEHESEHTKKLGNCYNEYKCKKCGYTYAIDSSD